MSLQLGAAHILPLFPIVVHINQFQFEIYYVRAYWHNLKHGFSIYQGRTLNLFFTQSSTLQKIITFSLTKYHRRLITFFWFTIRYYSVNRRKGKIFRHLSETNVLTFDSLKYWLQRERPVKTKIIIWPHVEAVVELYFSYQHRNWKNIRYMQSLEHFVKLECYIFK